VSLNPAVWGSAGVLGREVADEWKKKYDKGSWHSAANALHAFNTMGRLLAERERVATCRGGTTSLSIFWRNLKVAR
jgi:hypothetical protein